MRGLHLQHVHITERTYLHSRDVSYAVFCQGPYEETSRYREFMGYPVPWYSVPQDSVDRLIADRYFGILACYLRDGDQVFETYWTSGRGDEVMAPSYGLLDRTVHGRQEFWEDPPEGWPQRWGPTDPHHPFRPGLAYPLMVASINEQADVIRVPARRRR